VDQASQKPIVAEDRGPVVGLARVCLQRLDHDALAILIPAHELSLDDAAVKLLVKRIAVFA
jgi:hypothetical protein